MQAVRLKLVAISLAWALIWSAAAVQAADRKRSLPVDGTKRYYAVHLPKQKREGALPLVIVLHGAMGNAWSAQWDSQMNKRADEQSCSKRTQEHGSHYSRHPRKGSLSRRKEFVKNVKP